MKIETVNRGAAKVWPSYGKSRWQFLWLPPHRTAIATTFSCTVHVGWSLIKTATGFTVHTVKSCIKAVAYVQFFQLFGAAFTTWPKKIETATHAKVQARACSREHAPVASGTWLSQFFWPR